MISSAELLVCWASLKLAGHTESKRLILHIYYWIHGIIMSLNVLREYSPVPKPTKLWSLWFPLRGKKMQNSEFNLLYIWLYESSPYEYFSISFDKTTIRYTTTKIKILPKEMMTEIFYYCTTELSSQSNNNNNADYLLRNITISQWCFTLNSNPVRQHFCQKI